MSSKFEALEKLYELRKNGVLTEEEFNKEKDILLNKQNSVLKTGNLLGLQENTYCMLMHLSLLLAIVHPFIGLIVPLVGWALNKDNYPTVDNNGRVILNWVISMCIYSLLFFSIAIPMGFSMAFNFGNPLSMFSAFIPLIVLGVLNLIFIVRGALKANDGKIANYSLSFRFVKLK